MTTATEQVSNEMWDTVEGGNSDFEDIYPFIQWQHGSKQHKKGLMATGGFFISNERYAATTMNGFEQTEFITQGGTELQGFGAASANIAVIRLKKVWIQDDKGANVPKVHALVMLEGVDDLFIIALAKPSKALRFEEAFKQHRGQNVSLANRSKPSGKPNIEPFALWFPVKAGEAEEMSAKDDPNKKSFVTPPVLATPKVVDTDYVRSLWVGAENYKRFVEVWGETADWQHKPIAQAKPVEENDQDDPENGVLPLETQHQINKLCKMKAINPADMALIASNNVTSSVSLLSPSEAEIALDTLNSY